MTQEVEMMGVWDSKGSKVQIQVVTEGIFKGRMVRSAVSKRVEGARYRGVVWHGEKIDADQKFCHLVGGPENYKRIS